MSSGAWELVSKNKKDRTNNKSNKITKTDKKKFIENAPKVEDFLPLNQVKTLYDNLSGINENKKPVKENEEKKRLQQQKQQQHQKQQQQQQHQKQQQQAERKKQESKEKPPKTVKDALLAINPQEFDDVLTTTLSKFPEAPLVWLKNLAAFLNLKIPIEKDDVTFSGKQEDYPLCLVPKAISSTLERAVEIAGQQTVQLFYENTLTAMATDMVKGAPIVGHKIFLQLLAHLNPEITAANIPKLISIKNSYENRKNVSLSLLWAWSQAGEKDLIIGLEIWHKVMSPLLEVKSYANYVAQILNNLVFRHDNVHDLSFNLYLDIVEDVYSHRYNIPVNLEKNIDTSINKLRSILFKSKEINYTKLFEMLIGQITQKLNPNYRDELIMVLADCLVTEPLCFAIWGSLYTKHLYQSNLLLTYLDMHYPTLKTKIKVKYLKDTLDIIQSNNEKWKKTRDENLALACKVTTQALFKKMTSSSRRGFPWKFGSFLLLLLIGAIVAYDTQKHGSFEASQIGNFLKTSGILKYFEKTWTTIKLYWSAGHQTIKDSSPEYYKATVDLCMPYIKLVGDVYLTVKNISLKMYDNASAYVEKKTPIVLDTIEYYAPGIVEEVQVRSSQGLEFAKVSFIWVGEKMVEHSTATIQWLEHNVFVGKLSPESLRSYAVWALDTTQSYASQTYDWLYEKVQTLSKVP